MHNILQSLHARNEMVDIILRSLGIITKIRENSCDPLLLCLLPPVVARAPIITLVHRIRLLLGVDVAPDLLRCLHILVPALRLILELQEAL
jgi:hypothetical protein